MASNKAMMIPQIGWEKPVGLIVLQQVSGVSLTLVVAIFVLLIVDTIERFPAYAIFFSKVARSDPDL